MKVLLLVGVRNEKWRCAFLFCFDGQRVLNSFVGCFWWSKSLTFVVGCSFRESNGDMLATLQNPISWYPLVSPHFPVDLGWLAHSCRKCCAAEDVAVAAVAKADFSCRVWRFFLWQYWIPETGSVPFLDTDTASTRRLTRLILQCIFYRPKRQTRTTIMKPCHILCEEERETTEN